jgi:deoxycytidylate deaminase
MMRIAQRESQKGYGKYRLGSVITDRKGVVIGRGYNKGVTHPTFGNSYSGNLHAEASALVSALKSKRSLRGGTCYVYRVGGNLAKPCPCCQEFLRSHGIEKIVYSTKEGDMEEEL